MNWAYGITTVHQRLNTTFDRTLKSLATAGFDKPRLFIDSTCSIEPWQHYQLEITVRYPNIKTYGNWMLALMELYIREPLAERYAIFQDDFVTYRNLRCYLEAAPMPNKSYLNLFTFPSVDGKAKQAAPPTPNYRGWFQSNQLGKGAVALVFDNPGVKHLLRSEHMINKFQSINDRPETINGERWSRANLNVDGAVSDSFKEIRYREWIHSPSLTFHTGVESTLNHKLPNCIGFLGEEYDAMEFLKC